MTHLGHLQKKHSHSNRKCLYYMYIIMKTIEAYVLKEICMFVYRYALCDIYTVFLPILSRLAKYPSFISLVFHSQ